VRTPFQLACKSMPRGLYAGMDFLGQHKTVSDLRFAAQHEIDLFEEGDDNALPANDVRAIRRWMKKLPSED
jgi:hypothetical protein